MVSYAGLRDMYPTADGSLGPHQPVSVPGSQDRLGSVYPSSTGTGVSLRPDSPVAGVQGAATKAAVAPATAAPRVDELSPDEKAARLLYPSMMPPEEVAQKPPAQAADATAAPDGSGAAAAGQPGVGAQEAQPADGAGEPVAEVMPADFIATTNPVAWGEPAADAATIGGALERVAPMLPEATVPDRNERRAFAGALAQIGVGESLAAEIGTDLAAATAKAFVGTKEAGTAALTQLWGNRTAANLQAAKGVIDEMERAFPGTKQRLNETGLGNDPAFIRKVVAFAHARAARS